MLETSKLTIVLLAVVMAIGGIMGFVKGKSRASLIAGLGSAIALGASLAVIASNARQGLLMAFVVTGALVVVFYIRMKKSGKPMPGGPLMAICLVAEYFILQGVPPVK
jgi:uncharacterized membrane protein (UPF0136 family)